MSSKRAVLGVSEGAVAVCAPSSATVSLRAYLAPVLHAKRPASMPASETGDLANALTRAIGELKHASQPTNIVVGNDLSRHWVQQPPAGASSLREIQTVAALRFAELFGEAADRWHITGDWRTGTAFLCTAIPRWVSLAAQDALSIPVRHLQFHSLLGAALSSSRRQWPDAGWWCLQSPRAVVLGCMERGLPVRVRVMSLSATVSNNDPFTLAASALQQEASRHAGDAVRRARWFCLGAADNDRKELESTERNGLSFEVQLLGKGMPGADVTTEPVAAEAVAAATFGMRFRASR